MSPSPWPELPYAAWNDTCETLHRWTQIVGKVRLELTPWLNHSWHVPLYVTARGLTTGPIPAEGRRLEIEFDFIEHVLRLRTSDGRSARWHSGPCVAVSTPRCCPSSARWASTCASTTCRRRSRRGALSRRHAHASYDREAVDASAVRCFPARGVRGVPHRLHRQGEPGAFLLGQLRPGGHAFLRPESAAAPAAAGPARRRDPRGLFARGVQRGLLAGQRGDRLSRRSTSYAYPSRRVSRGEGAAGRGVLDEELGGFFLPYDDGADGERPRRANCSLSCRARTRPPRTSAKWDRAALEAGFGERGNVRVVPGALP